MQKFLKLNLLVRKQIGRLYKVKTISRWSIFSSIYRKAGVDCMLKSAIVAAELRPGVVYDSSLQLPNEKYFVVPSLLLFHLHRSCEHEL